MSKSSRKGKETVVHSILEDESDDFPREEDHDEDGNGGSGSVPDWRLEMRHEIRAAIAETLSGRPLQLEVGPSEIDARDVVDKDQLADMMRKIESNNVATKTAIRLANITKDGNKQHFLDMIKIREEVEKARFAIKELARMYVEDVNLAKESLEKVDKMIESRMSMIEKVDTHPLSWPVATEFQKMKRARCEGEDDKLFAAAEKKVKEDRKTKNDEAKLKTQTGSKQKLSFMQRPSQPQGRFGNVTR